MSVCGRQFVQFEYHVLAVEIDLEQLVDRFPLRSHLSRLD
jgi:hypothetical protein